MCSRDYGVKIRGYTRADPRHISRGKHEKEDSCKTCGLSRWIIREKKGTSDSNLEKVIHKVPANVMREHRALVAGQAKLKKYKREREHNDDFWKWMKEQVTNKLNILRELEVLAMGPNRATKEYRGYVINRYRFHSKNRDAKCKTQNSGVFLTALTTSFASSKDENPTVGNVNYYGAIEEIVGVDYWGEFSVVVFKCCWMGGFHITIHHEGEFQRTRYTGGKEFLVRGVDPDKFSFTVLLEHVKDDLHYSEFGGIYIQEKLGDWKLVTNDSDMFTLIGEVSSGDHIHFYMDDIVDNKIELVKQMQPHVIMRPRHNILEVKHTFVTTHQLQQKQRNKKIVEVDMAQVVTRKSPRLNNLKQDNDATVRNKSGTAKRKLNLQSQPHQDENIGENDLESTILPPPPPLTEYEIQRAITVERNNKVYMALNLPTLSAELRSSVQKKNSEKEKLEPRKRMKKKLLMGRGATTRSRANAASKTPAIEEAIQKETCPPVQDTNSAVPNIELPQADDGNGSMAAFIAMRKRQRKKAEREKAIVAAANASYNRVVEENALQYIEEGGEAVVAPKRLRGKTKMDKVHRRSYDNRIVIQVNEFFQPITDSDGVLSELSNFLGTLAKLCVSYARYIIPDECEKWVEDYIRAAWKGYKCRIKAAHYTAYTNDDNRLQSRPDDIPLERFKMLLEYRNDDSVQARAKKNAASRKSYLDTHTAGLKSFAQVRNKMAPNSSAPCDAEIYFETRERSDNREYKIDHTIMKSKLEKISKKLSTGDNWEEAEADVGVNMSMAQYRRLARRMDAMHDIHSRFACDLTQALGTVFRATGLDIQ
ncbi:hypothetical protein AgCh_038856 [Apium graveolens]